MTVEKGGFCFGNCAVFFLFFFLVFLSFSSEIAKGLF